MDHTHDDHPTLVLSENDYGTLCKCKSCKQYTLAYKTIVIPFNQKSFYAFEKVLKCFKPADFNMYHPQGMKAVIRNNHSDLSIAFTYSEVQDLLKLYREAKLMDEVFAILSS
ncbi:MAG: DUF6686 family protein [Flammeovirgaceae bacterium]